LARTASLSHSLFCDEVLAFSPGFNDKFAVDRVTLFFDESSSVFGGRKNREKSVSLEKQRKSCPPFISKTHLLRSRDAQIASSIIRF
jgi:hypothetical protein|tara:strand:- start:580 stop:840 length:261 start_codon:yes stop_codon:yes gene_type:complete